MFRGCGSFTKQDSIKNGDVTLKGFPGNVIIPEGHYYRQGLQLKGKKESFQASQTGRKAALGNDSFLFE
jgi:hypothetical protein